MIFVSVGTQKFQFNRLIKAVDLLKKNGMLQEEVYAQIGNSDYEPENFAFRKYMNHTEYIEKIEQCDVLVTHSGVATIMEGLRRNKKVIVVPRLAAYKEHVDDHQVQIAENFFAAQYVAMCMDTEQLADVIALAKKQEFRPYVSNRKDVIRVIEDYLQSNCGR